MPSFVYRDKEEARAVPRAAGARPREKRENERRGQREEEEEAEENKSEGGGCHKRKTNKTKKTEENRKKKLMSSDISLSLKVLQSLCPSLVEGGDSRLETTRDAEKTNENDGSGVYDFIRRLSGDDVAPLAESGAASYWGPTAAPENVMKSQEALMTEIIASLLRGVLPDIKMVREEGEREREGEREKEREA